MSRGVGVLLHHPTLSGVWIAVSHSTAWISQQPTLVRSFDLLEEAEQVKRRPVTPCCAAASLSIIMRIISPPSYDQACPAQRTIHIIYNVLRSLCPRNLRLLQCLMVCGVSVCYQMAVLWPGDTHPSLSRVTCHVWPGLGNQGDSHQTECRV